MANIEQEPVGFALGFELKPSVFFGWLLGVLPSQRREGVASQLLEAMTTWAAEREYQGLRMECHNAHRPILHLAIEKNFNIVGVRWDPDRQDNLVILERDLTDVAGRLIASASVFSYSKSCRDALRWPFVRIR